ncbi:hypothetical protein EYF80_025915 [Liparis tanakae]|uniref:Uncharacterized protein n=1 Tax=Liparis tanakae TaxID=230148 RepID=A0A4Z2HDR7_9TELE|nr:hypothetical protein EYF80_025915 [Liparis tanakae]
MHSPIGEYLQLEAGSAVELPSPQDPFEVPEIRRRPPLQPAFNLPQPLIQARWSLRLGDIPERRKALGTDSVWIGPVMSLADGALSLFLFQTFGYPLSELKSRVQSLTARERAANPDKLLEEPRMGSPMEGFAAVLTDGRPLPASSERLNERRVVITQLPTPLPEERGRQRGTEGVNESRNRMESQRQTMC